MEILGQISFDEIVGSFFICVILALPDHIAGPGGWLIDTGANEN